MVMAISGVTASRLRGIMTNWPSWKVATRDRREQMTTALERSLAAGLDNSIYPLSTFLEVLHVDLMGLDLPDRFLPIAIRSCVRSGPRSCRRIGPSRRNVEGRWGPRLPPPVATDRAFDPGATDREADPQSPGLQFCERLADDGECVS